MSSLAKPAGKTAVLPLGVEALAAVNALEKEIGGRAGLLAALALAPLTRDTKYLQGVLADPANTHRPLLSLLEEADTTPGVLLSLVQKGLAATSSLRSQYLITTGVPAVVKDVMLRGAPYQADCHACGGLGSTTPEPTAAAPNPVHGPCATCAGVGQLSYPADPDCRDLALDLSGLLPKAGGGVSIVNQQLAVTQVSLGGGDTERFQEAMDQVLFGGGGLAPPPASAAPPIDITPSPEG